MVNESSVSQYAYKKEASVGNNICGMVVEQLVSRVLKSSIVALEQIVPMIHRYVAPVMDIAAQVQMERNKNILSETKNYYYGIWKTVFCVNATTEDLHTERDCGYTIIHVPLRDKKMKSLKYQFHFQINKRNTICLPMDQNLTFMFLAFLLIHRQQCFSTEKELSNNEEFFNFATYANKKLFNHVKNQLIE